MKTRGPGWRIKKFAGCQFLELAPQARTIFRYRTPHRVALPYIIITKGKIVGRLEPLNPRTANFGFQLPLPNTYDHGGVCLGDYTIPPDMNVNGTEYLFFRANRFFQSRFTTPLDFPQTRLNGKFMTLQAWAKATAEGKTKEIRWAAERIRLNYTNKEAAALRNQYPTSMAAPLREFAGVPLPARYHRLTRRIRTNRNGRKT